MEWGKYVDFRAEFVIPGRLVAKGYDYNVMVADRLWDCLAVKMHRLLEVEVVETSSYARVNVKATAT